MIASPLLGLTLMLALASVAPAKASAAARRSEVEIVDVVLTDHTHRYAIQITVGSQTLLAGLDTGSTGLRILPQTLRPTDARPTTEADRFSFASGVELEGVKATANVAIGALAGAIPLQLVQSVGCVAQIPQCPAAKVSADHYRLEGDGLADEGFRAILGLDLAQAAAPNPLVALGASRWIVELPRPDIAGAGRLILNPRDDEVAGFTRLATLAWAGGRGVRGCIADDATKARECGILVLDTGAPGVRVVNGHSGPRAWPPGSGATLALGADQASPLIERFRVAAGVATRLAFEHSDRVGTVIYVGPLPFFVFSILFGPGPETLALEPRPSPTGHSP